MSTLCKKSPADRIAAVEALTPGFKVIAGPFNVDSSSVGAQHRREALDAVNLQKRAGCAWEVKKYRGLVYVLRSAVGWTDSEEVKSLRLQVGEVGLSCPVCGRHPFSNLHSLRLHRCPKLPLYQMGDRLYHGRLSKEQIQQAKEAGRR